MDEFNYFYEKVSKFIIILSPMLTIIIVFFTYRNNLKIRRLQEEIHLKQINDDLKLEILDLYDLLKTFIQHLGLRITSIYHPNMVLHDYPEYLRGRIYDYNIYEYKSIISFFSTDDIKYIEKISNQIYFLKHPIKSRNLDLAPEITTYSGYDLKYLYGVGDLSNIDKKYWKECYIDLLVAKEEYLIEDNRLLEILKIVDDKLNIEGNRLSLKYIFDDIKDAINYGKEVYDNPFLKSNI